MFPNRPTSIFSEDIIFESSPNPMWIYDLDTLKFLKVNREAVLCYGYTEEEFMDMDLCDIRLPEDAIKPNKAIEYIDHRSGDNKVSYFKHCKKDGTVFPVHLKSNLISYLGKRAELVVAMDISESIVHERQQFYHKRLFQCITDISNNLIRNPDWLKALDACFSILCENLKIDCVYFLQSDLQNDSIVLKLYRTRQNDDAKNERLNKEHLPFPLMRLLLNQIRKGRKFQRNLTALSDELEREVFISRGIKSLLALPILTQHGVRGVIGLEDCRNERKWTAEEQQVLHVLTSNLSHLINQSDALNRIRESERKFRSLVQNGTDFISILDENKNYVYASPTHVSQLGFELQSLYGTDYFNKVHVRDIDKLREAFKQSESQREFYMTPYRFLDGKGHWKWMQGTITNRLTDSNIGGIIINTSDVTDEVSQKVKRELVLSIAKKLGSHPDLKGFLVQMQKRICKSTSAKGSEIWLLSKDESVLFMNSLYHRQKKMDYFMEQGTVPGHLELGQGVAGKVWSSQKSVRIDEIRSHEDFIGVVPTWDTGCTTSVGLPLRNGKEFLGCIILSFDLPKNELDLSLKCIEGIGADIGGVIKQKSIEEEYREFFEISPDPFCVIGCDGKIKLVNNACANALGFSKEHFLGVSFEHFIHESDRWKVIQKFVNGITSNIDTGNEIRMITATNQERWLVWSGTLHREQKLIFAVAKDITEIKKAELAMESTLKKLQHAQRLGKLGYWYRELDSMDSEWSPETYAIYGYDSKNFTPTFENLVKTFIPEERHLMKEHPKNYLSPGEVKAFEHRIITANGDVKWVHQEIQMVMENGRPSHIEGTIQDITERKEYQQQLEVSNKRFLLAMLASNQMIWEWDPLEGTIQFSQVKDSGREEIIKETLTREGSWFTRIYEEDRAQVWRMFTGEFQKERIRDSGSIEYRVYASDGSIRNVVDKYYVKKTANDSLVSVVGSVSDITESKIQIDRIKRQNKGLSEIAWLQSHAVRGPLTRIMALLKHSRNRGNEKISTEDLLQMISISVTEIDKELHKIIELTEVK